MSNLSAQEADAEYLHILKELHDFAQATGAMPGTDVVQWFVSVGVGLHSERRLAPAINQQAGGGDD